MSKEKKKFKDTKVGQWLKDNAPNVLDAVDDVFPPVKLLTALVGGSNIPDEKKLEFEKVVLEYEQNELKAYLADVADSRDMNARIQETDHASWLAKNAAYIFDSAIILAFIICLFLILKTIVPETNKELFYTGFGALASYVSQILSFHRGSSKGSEDKQKMLDKIMRK